MSGHDNRPDVRWCQYETPTSHSPGTQMPHLVEFENPPSMYESGGASDTWMLLDTGRYMAIWNPLTNQSHTCYTLQDLGASAIAGQGSTVSPFRDTILLAGNSMEPISQNGAFEIWLGLRLCLSLFSSVSYFNQNGCARVETVWKQVDTTLRLKGPLCSNLQTSAWPHRWRDFLGRCML